MSDIIVIEAAPDVIVTVNDHVVTTEVISTPAVNSVTIELYGVIQGADGYTPIKGIDYFDGASAAVGVSLAPIAGLSPTAPNVQAGMEALQTDKAPKASPAFTGNLTYVKDGNYYDVRLGTFGEYFLELSSAHITAPETFNTGFFLNGSEVSLKRLGKMFLSLENLGLVFPQGCFSSGDIKLINGAKVIDPITTNLRESIAYEELTADKTVSFAAADILYFYINPAGASVALTMPSDPGSISKSGILWIKNNTDKTHTWAASPTIRFVSEADADTIPTPAAAGYWTRYTAQWHDNNGGAGFWAIALAGRDTA